MAPSSAAIGGQLLDLYRANAAWTRVIFCPKAPIAVAAPEGVLTLTFTTSEGIQAGGRRLRAVPSVLEREGL
jgi:hypothetical protein